MTRADILRARLFRMVESKYADEFVEETIDELERISFERGLRANDYVTGRAF